MHVLGIVFAKQTVNYTSHSNRAHWVGVTAKIDMS